MQVPPIKDGARMTQEEAIRSLMREGFTSLEAESYLAISDPATRKGIFDYVRQRQGGKGGALV
jgi:hypothetical protein